MTKTEKIKQAVIGFVKGGDTSDTQLLNAVLHKDFRVTSNNFLGEPGVAILDKAGYLNNIEKGIFGGLPRKMEIELIDESKTIAMVKIRLESAENNFVSYNSLVLDTDNEWKLINNHVVVEAKKV
ncbi:nuclear transport factor 2 family protein [Flavobacterium amniphilum]|uniref:nuclear transport factor 2 family protein n=1 Tax=Flavobacterium amniphilum TaxID=1834035 RepID=UPI002029FA39|nr:nuclear transport factor 2 family protein [Flavobacterium amniphilum]MCL9807542.1 nuclear transport factor 2 family protein [Flavobacterium amniphilum]